MERQPKDTGSFGEGNAEGTDAGSEAGFLSESDIKHLRKDVKELTSTLKEIKKVLKSMVAQNKSRIPGVK